MKRLTSLLNLVIVLIIALLGVTPVKADGIVIDNLFADWSAKPSKTDPGGVDDETSPRRADITEFRADASSSGLYLLMAWDNTSFTGGQASTAGITVRGVSGTYYRVYETAQGNPASISLADLDIDICTDSTCASTSNACSGASCTGSQIGSGTNWNDPFASASGRTASDCSGTNCLTLDTAAEIYLPWALVGGAPADGDTVFLQFGSYPSGPAQAPKDDMGPDGITCRNLAGVFECYTSTPTAIHLIQVSATSLTLDRTWVLAVFAVAIISLARWPIRRR